MEEKHIVDFIIPSYQVDGNRKLRPSCFMSLAQEVAMQGAEALNFGYDALAAHHLAWVISRTHLEFVNTPSWKDTVRFATWHKGIDGLFFLRDYLLTDPEGNTKIKGASSWIVLDTQSRRLFRTDRLSEYFDVTPQCLDNAVEHPADKIVIPAGLESEAVGTHTVKYSDLDFIGHANNTSYINWAMDLLPEHLEYGSALKELDINFNLETRADETIDFYRAIQKTPDEEIIFIEGKVAGRSHFTARFKF